MHAKPHGVTFYRPAEVPDGFFCLGYYCQSNDQPLRGYILVAREATSFELQANHTHGFMSESPPLKNPLNYSLIWSIDSPHDGRGYFWLPNPPMGYEAMGIMVTAKP